MRKLITILLLIPLIAKGQFAPPAGQPGTTAIYKDSTIIVNWATQCTVKRGWQNIADTTLGLADVGDSSMACGSAGTNGVVSLGDRGLATLTFQYPVKNGLSWDFAVFENSFSDTFLELAFVEVSSDGINFYRFPSTSLTDTAVQVDTYGELDATKINNLAGKYRLNYGTPFDLDELSGISGLDINHITHIRVVDVIGSIDKQYASYDSYGHVVNDPWPTPFPSSGIDLDAVGVIHQDMSSIRENAQATDMSIFPNPCQNEVNVSWINDTKPSHISLIDLKGRVLTDAIPCGNILRINSESIAPGIYLLRINCDVATTYYKLVKE
jgi:hypothetical protein